MGKSWKDSHRDDRFHDPDEHEYDRHNDYIKQKNNKESRVLRELKKRLRDIEVE